MYKDDSVLPYIEANYDQLTTVEKFAADFFLKNTVQMDFSARAISQKLSISEASLSRFAKKCGFRGYREFIYIYERSLNSLRESENISSIFSSALDSYQQLLSRAYSLISEDQIVRVARMLASAGRIITLGIGSSGYAAGEFAFRFMRTGLDITAITDAESMKILSLFRQPQDLVIAFSLSGAEPSVLDFLKGSYQHGAKTVLITAGNHPDFPNFIHEILLIPSLERMDRGNLISPQFPTLIMSDMLYAAFMETDREKREKMLACTVAALEKARKAH